jgi:HlyD family secretion protein
MKANDRARSAALKLRGTRSGFEQGARWLLGGVLVGALALAAAACSRGEASESAALQTADVLRQNMRITAEATGQVEPVRSVDVKSKASGEVLRLHVDVGDYVQPGTLLAQIDPRDVQNSYDQAVADLEVARARSEIAEAQLGRSTQLFEAGVITQQEMESQRLDYANSRASLVKAETNKMLAELRREDVTIRAPIAGTVLARNVEEGTVIQSASSNVSGGTTLFVMADLQEVQIRTLVDETDIGQIRADLEASIQVEAYPGRSFPGSVRKIEPKAVNQQNVTMFPVIVRLDNRAGLLKPGMNAEVEMLLVEHPDVLVVPNNAVVLPQEVSPAATVLGLDPETVTIDRAVYAQLAREAGLGAVQGMTGRGRGTGGGRPAAEGAQASAEGAAPTGEGVRPSPAAGDRAAAAGARPPAEGAAGASPELSAAMAERRARMDSLRARVERGEIPRDSLDAMRASFRAQGGGAPGTPAGGAPAQGFTLEDSNPALSGLLNTSSAPRPAVAFVLRPDSTLEARPVLMGVNDWDNTEILAGLQEGEKIALIGVAQLQAEQQAMRERMAGRGFMPGMGGPPMGGMGRR